MANFWEKLSALFVTNDAGSMAPADEAPEQRSISSLERGGPIDAQTLAPIAYVSKSGVIVDAEQLLSLPAFWRAIKILSGVIASLPLEVVEESQDGTENVNRLHPVSTLLNINPSPLYSRFKFLETLVLHLYAYGNFYAVIHQRLARPTKLTIIEKPFRVVVKYDARGGLLYEYEDKTYSGDRIIHIAGMSWNGIVGYDPSYIHRDNYGMALSNRDYGVNFYANGAHLSGTLNHPGKMTKEAYDRLRQSWDARYAGGVNAGKTAVLEEGMEYKPIGLKPSDAQFIETKKTTTSDISLLTGVPRFLLEDSDPTFNNGETITRLFTNFTILPLCENIESEFNRKLFMTDEIGRVRTRFNLNQLLRADTEQRGRYIDNLMKWGIINRDEARKMEGWNPIPDGTGQAYYVPLNMVDPNNPEPAPDQNPAQNQNDDEQGDTGD